MTMWRDPEQVENLDPNGFPRTAAEPLLGQANSLGIDLLFATHERAEWEVDHPPTGGYITLNGELVYYFSKSPLDIVREFAPGVTDDEANSILWEFTGWPMFWRGEPEISMRRSLAESQQEIVEFVEAKHEPTE